MDRASVGSTYEEEFGTPISSFSIEESRQSSRNLMRQCHQ